GGELAANLGLKRQFLVRLAYLVVALDQFFPLSEHQFGWLPNDRRALVAEPLSGRVHIDDAISGVQHDHALLHVFENNAACHWHNLEEVKTDEIPRQRHTADAERQRRKI